MPHRPELLFPSAFGERVDRPVGVEGDCLDRAVVAALGASAGSFSERALIRGLFQRAVDAGHIIPADRVERTGYRHTTADEDEPLYRVREA
ncbi:MAG TPA: hypothetical protein VGB14_01750 [Acidimicrobiales bacterium]|jgi:hypothetical protein